MAKKRKQLNTRVIPAARISYDKEGHVIVGMDYVTDMGIRYGRLVRAARNGDKEAQKKLEELEKSPPEYITLVTPKK
jgi:hypothetical protein